jgi:prevent-host-death family protein
MNPWQTEFSRAPMHTVSIRHAKTHLSKLVEQAAGGEPFVITKAGKPMVKVVSLEAREPAQVRRIGFLAGQIVLPPDFDRMGEREIQAVWSC